MQIKTNKQTKQDKKNKTKKTQQNKKRNKAKGFSLYQYIISFNLISSIF